MKFREYLLNKSTKITSIEELKTLYEKIKSILRKSSIPSAKFSAQGDKGFGISPDKGGYSLFKEFNFAQTIRVSFHSPIQVTTRKQKEIDDYKNEFKKLLRQNNITGGEWYKNEIAWGVE